MIATSRYDRLDRLTKICYTVACTAPGDNFRTYTYDPVGSRLTEVRDRRHEDRLLRLRRPGFGRQPHLVDRGDVVDVQLPAL